MNRKKKPKGVSRRNLTLRGHVIYYQRVVNGKRVRFSCETNDWYKAACARDLYEAKKGIGRIPVPILEAPTLRDFAKRYLREDTEHLSATTRGDRSLYLGETSPLMLHLGDTQLDEITPARLREWWAQEIQGKRAASTGRHYINVLASVIDYARDLGLLDATPIPEFREQLRRRSRTKGGRAEAAAGAKVSPIERPEELGALLAAARAEGLPPQVLVTLLLDAGLRLGESLALRWGSIAFGTDEADTGRHLHITESRPRGGEAEAPKSGRARKVALSNRLRAVLLELYRDRFEPGPAALVLEGIEPANFRKREWRRILKRAAIGHRAMKDLRDTYASQLLTAGVNLAYVSRQLGHADIQVTTRHYARWCGGDE